MNKTVISGNVNSASIRKHFGQNAELEIVDNCGAGDSRITLYRAVNTGVEVIETNGDSLWETDDGFAEARERFTKADDHHL